jgi:hypothetical protein
MAQVKTFGIAAVKPDSVNHLTAERQPLFVIATTSWVKAHAAFVAAGLSNMSLHHLKGYGYGDMSGEAERAARANVGVVMVEVSSTDRQFVPVEPRDLHISQ